MKARNLLLRFPRGAGRDGAPGDDGARVTRQGVGQFRADDHGAGQRNAGRRRPTRATMLRITWALGTDTDIDVIADWFLEWTEFPEWIPRRSPASVARPSSSPARASTRSATRTPPTLGSSYNAWSDGAPIGFAGNGGELWRIEYLVTNPVTDAAADISYRFDDVLSVLRRLWPAFVPDAGQCVAAHRRRSRARPRFSCSGWGWRASQASAGSFASSNLVTATCLRLESSEIALRAAPRTTRDFVAADESVPPPARSQQPGLRLGRPRGDRREEPGPRPIPRTSGPRTRDRRSPGVRRSRGSLRRVLSRVEEHVAKRRSHLPGRAERAVVIAAVEHRSPPLEDPIHGPREARGQALHPIRQGRDALRFDEQVDVIVLERVVDDAEVCALRDRAERALHFANQAHRSQRRHVAANANRHQAGMALRKLRPPAMPHPRSRRSLSPGTFSRTTPTHRHLRDPARAAIDASYT